MATKIIILFQVDKDILLHLQFIIGKEIAECSVSNQLQLCNIIYKEKYCMKITNLMLFI